MKEAEESSLPKSFKLSHKALQISDSGPNLSNCAIIKGRETDCMKKLPKPKGFRLLLLVVSAPVLILSTLVFSIITLVGIERFELAAELSKDQPSRLPRVFYYSLFAQKPPEGEVLGETVSVKEGSEAQLRAYLEWQGSPMAEAAGTFIEVARKYNLDWRLIPAIAGKESTFGKAIPWGSHNAFGWGIYGSQVLRYASWNESIEAVGKGLADYASRGIDTVREIEYTYCPQSANSHHAWRDGVEYFLWEIQSYPDF